MGRGQDPGSSRVEGCGDGASIKKRGERDGFEGHVKGIRTGHGGLLVKGGGG